MVINRSLQTQFDKSTELYKIVAIVGPRQSGKTTFLKQQSKEKTKYLLFDDPDIRALFEADIKKFEIQFMQGNNVTVLDEVQYCHDAGRKLKYLADTGKRIWVTASSEIILSKEILSFLVGRVSILRLFPFSFTEFLDGKKQKAYTDEILERLLWEHMTFGGYPHVVLTEESEQKKIILQNLYETMILKDIAQTFSLEDIRTLENCSKYLAVNIGNLLSYETMCNQLNISFQTIKKYLNAMEKSYLIIRIPPYYTNKTKEITKQPKIYFIDTGLRNAILKTFPINADGKLFENYVLSELMKKGFTVKYWRSKTKAEVDFIVEHNSEIIPIEVKINADPEKIGRSLLSFISQYKPTRAYVISSKPIAKKIKREKCTINFITPDKIFKNRNGFLF